MRKAALIISTIFICAALSGCETKEITPLSEIYQNQLTINGITYSVPFSLDELGEEYSINTVPESEANFHEIKYNNVYFAAAYTNTADVTNTITYISFADDSGFEFGEVYYGNTKSKIEKAHGSADTSVKITDVETVFYYLNNDVALSIMYEKNKVIFYGFYLDGSIKQVTE